MKRTPFRPLLERLEERETPSASAMTSSMSGLNAASTSSLLTTAAGVLPLLTIVQQVRTDVSSMTSLNTTLGTDMTTLTTAINGMASATTIAGDFGKASSDFAQISTLNNEVQSLARSGQLSALLGLFTGLSSGKTSSQNSGNSSNNNTDSDDTDDVSNSNNSKSGSMMKMMMSSTQIDAAVGLIALLSLSQETKTASSTFSQANTTASQTLPGGYPTVASTVSVPSSTTSSSGGLGGLIP